MKKAALSQIEEASEQFAEHRIDLITAGRLITQAGGLMVGTAVSERIHYPTRTTTLREGAEEPLVVGPKDALDLPLLRATVSPAIAAITAVTGKRGQRRQLGKEISCNPVMVSWEHDPDVDGFYSIKVTNSLLRVVAERPTDVLGAIDVIDGKGAVELVDGNPIPGLDYSVRPDYNEPGQFITPSRRDRITSLPVYGLTVTPFIDAKIIQPI